MDRRAARTRRALHEALMALILRKGYEAVSVQDVVDEADVGRSTFYAHYSGKEQLLRGGFERLRALLTEAQREAAAKSDGGAPLGFSLAMFEHAAEYRDIYLALVGGRGGVVALNEIRRVLSEVVRRELSGIPGDDAVPRDLRVQFIVATFLAVLTWWLERKPELGPAKVDAMFRGLLLDGVGSSLRAVPARDRARRA